MAGHCADAQKVRVVGFSKFRAVLNLVIERLKFY